MEDWITSSWESIGRLAFMSTSAYVGLILILRVSGARTLSQLNAFDFVVTVALGSILATVILNKSIPLTEGLAALGFLVLLQYIVSFLSVRFKTIRRVIKSEPVLLFYNGTFIHETLRERRITEDEVLQMLRSNGINKLDEIQAVVLETNGKYSVIKGSASDQHNSSLKNVQGIVNSY
jgi:uncharacterized membrane protein YcaP (DUF421 family)